MAFAYGIQDTGRIPSLGDDNSPVYGYAQEHHTLELWLNIWKEHTKNVQQLGTPPHVDACLIYLRDFGINAWGT